MRQEHIRFLDHIHQNLPFFRAHLRLEIIRLEEDMVKLPADDKNRKIFEGLLEYNYSVLMIVEEGFKERYIPNLIKEMEGL